MMFQAEDELLIRARRIAHERGVSVAQLVRDALEKELGGSDSAPLMPKVIGAGRCGRDDLSELAGADVYEPDPWASS